MWPSERQCWPARGSWLRPTSSSVNQIEDSVMLARLSLQQRVCPWYRWDKDFNVLEEQTGPSSRGLPPPPLPSNNEQHGPSSSWSCWSSPRSSTTPLFCSSTSSVWTTCAQDQSLQEEESGPKLLWQINFC